MLFKTRENLEFVLKFDKICQNLECSKIVTTQTFSNHFNKVEIYNNINYR